MTTAIKIENFSHKYPDGTDSLENINLEIKKGEKIGFIGPNGAGKSSLLLALAGFLKGTGKISINGIELNKGNIKSIRQIIGIVMQNPDDQLFMPTLFEDIAFGPMNMGLDIDEIKHRVHHALETVGLAKMGEKEPHHLSAGQKRAAAIATILSMSPKIIVMDEPEANLDPGARRNLVSLIEKMSQTIIIATCNMDFAASLCEKVYLLNNKKVITSGPAREIMADEKLMLDNSLEVPRNILV